MQLRAIAAVLVLASAAHADGVVGVRGAYYKERSTRVIQPMIDAAFDAGESGRAEGHFLIDSITSASASTGAGAAEFTEERYELGIGYVHEIAPVRVGGDVRYSTESDYNAFVFGLRGELDLAEKTTLLRLRFQAGWDDVTNGVEVDMGGIGTPRRSEKLSTTLVSGGVQQLIGDRLVLSATYDLMRASGYQANIYRVVFGGPMPVPERVPDGRLRHALAASGRWWFPSETVLVGSVRLYHDDWGIDAITPEVRVVQQIISGIDVRLRYRVHAQTRAEFYEDVYTAEEIADAAVHVTDDEKLSAHHTHTVGVQGVFALRRLGVSGSWGDAQLDLVIERVWQSTSFGHAWVAQAGLVLPFAY